MLKVTRYMLVTLIAIAVLLDIALVLLWGVEATFSWQIKENTTALMLLGVGMLVGHLFWPQYRDDPKTLQRLDAAESQAVEYFHIIQDMLRERS